MIQAEVHSDDCVMSTNFDATPWFENASPASIKSLAECDFGGDYPADAVAQDSIDTDDSVKDVLEYVEKAYAATGNIGFECYVDEEQAMAWLKENRTDVYECIMSNRERSI